MEETTLSFHVFSDLGVCEATCCKGKTPTLIFSDISLFSKFSIIRDFFSRWDQHCKDRFSVFSWWWSAHVLGCVRARFNTLLWIKHLTKLKLTHLAFNISLARVWHDADMPTTQCRLIFCDNIHFTQPWEMFPVGSLSIGGRLSLKPLGFNESRFFDRKLFFFFK